jgi:xanthine dehydrogenase accessory factor
VLGEKAPSSTKNPAGLDLGATSPEEIAISIFAEIVQLRAAVARKVPPPPLSADAIDPICGMTVKIEGAKHRATRDGREYYFCCAGCRERFLAGAGA